VKTITVDFESFWSQDYTLSKMTTQEYVRDPRFQLIGMGFAVGNDRPRYVSGPTDVMLAAAALPWSESVVIAHNAQFDGAILEWLIGFHARTYFCTMQAANACVKPWTGSASLASCATYFNLPEKMTGILQATRGLRHEQLTLEQRRAMAEYCKHDVMITRELFQRMRDKFNEDETDLIDLTIKKYVRPKIVLSRKRIKEAQYELEQRRTALLTQLGDEKWASATISSNEKFAEALRALGVEPPMKVSGRTGQQTYAFAKTDPDFLELQEHDDPDVQTLVNVRIGAKSTLEESRLEKFLRIADIDPDQKLAVPLTYYGAGTGRMSARDGINLQNLTKKSPIRDCLTAPPGYKVVTADLSQIEARVLACIAGQDDLLEEFATGADPYSSFATDLYGVPVSKEENTDLRDVGKAAILQLGFYAGVSGFDRYLKTKANNPQPLDEVERIVNAYRRRYGHIAKLWKWMEKTATPVILGTNGGATCAIANCVYSTHQLTLPNGMPIYYPHARRQLNGDVIYDSFRGKSGAVKEVKLWPGLLTENIVQALARIILSTAEVSLARAGLLAALQVHDELVFIVKEAAVRAVSLALRRAMTQRVSWMPNLPLACDIKVGNTYKEAK